MTGKKALLVLRLEGAFQSWGESSKWDYRDSADFPTKSGIIGIIACSIGIDRNDKRLSILSEQIKIAVRADRSGFRTVDFQTIKEDSILTAEGKRKGGTIVSSRAYLQDACFTVFIETHDNLRKQIIDAFRNPKWCIYLGRKNCVPSRPVLECEAFQCRGLYEAMHTYPLSDRAAYPVSYEIEEEVESLSSYTRPDIIREGYREFHNRRVWRGVIKENDHVLIEN